VEEFQSEASRVIDEQNILEELLETHLHKESTRRRKEEDV